MILSCRADNTIFSIINFQEMGNCQGVPLPDTMTLTKPSDIKPAQICDETYTKVESRCLGIRYKKVITASVSTSSSYDAEAMSKCTSVTKKQIY